MPKQVTGITAVDHGDGTGTLQIGNIGHPFLMTDLFDFSRFDAEQVREACRLAFLVGNFTTPNAAFITAANNNGTGIETRSGNVTILSVTLDSPGVWMVMFKFNGGPFSGQAHGFPIRNDYLTSDTGDITVLFPFAVGLLRKNNLTSLTQKAKTTISGASFWI